MQQFHLLKLLFPLFSWLSCNVQAFDLLEMIKKEEEMLSAVKDRQSKVVKIMVEVFMDCF